MVGGLARITASGFQWAGDRFVDTFEKVFQMARDSGYAVDDQATRDQK